MNNLEREVSLMPNDFQGVSFLCNAICHHTIGPFMELRKYVDVRVYAGIVSKFRGLDTETEDLTIIETDFNDYDKLIQENRRRVICVWGGLRPSTRNDAFYNAVQVLRKTNIVINLFQESFPHFDGIKAFLRKLKWFYKFQFGKERHAKYIGVAGDVAMRLYRPLVYPHKRLFQFIYTPYSSKYQIAQTTNSTMQFVIVGQLIHRKWVLETIDIFKRLPNVILKIVGAGPLDTKINDIIQDYSHIQFLGFKSRESVEDIMSTADVLLLPSTFDGYGCTTNEALLRGCRVIASTGAGSHFLVNYNERFGCCFQTCNQKSYEQAVLSEIAKGCQTLSDRKLIHEWAKCLLPEVESLYLVKIINYVLGVNKEMPTPPWKQQASLKNRYN